MTQRPHQVLVVTSNYPRWTGDSTTPFVHRLAVDMTERGWSVSVLAPHAPGARRLEEMDGVTVRRFRYLLPERAETVCYGGGALINLRESRVNLLKVPALVAAEWAATAAALSRDAALVHAHWALPQGFVAATTPRRRVPRLLTVHGGDVYGLRGGVLDRFTAFALRRADRVTVNSPATRRAVDGLAGAAAHVDLVPMGVDTAAGPRPELVAEVRRRYRSGDGPVLVFAGRLVEEKGVEDVVSATAVLAARLPGVSAVLAGAGQHEGRVRELAARLGVGDRVHLPGWVEPEDVPSWLAAADVVLAPSRVGPGGWEEGQGLAVIEAMVAGAVVVATRTGGIPDTVDDGVTGLLVPPSDPEALAAAVSRVVADREWAESVRAAARSAAVDRFGREATADRFDSIYRELAGSGP